MQSQGERKHMFIYMFRRRSISLKYKQVERRRRFQSPEFQALKRYLLNGRPQPTYQKNIFYEDCSLIKYSLAFQRDFEKCWPFGTTKGMAFHILQSNIGLKLNHLFCPCYMSQLSFPLSYEFCHLQVLFRKNWWISLRIKIEN